jgi:hypothetical protein
MVSAGFITFGDGSRSWKDAASRLSRQASHSGFFTTVGNYNFSSIKGKLTGTDLDFIRGNPFGFGYFLFKPIVILHFLEENPEVEVVVYLDAGSEIHCAPEKREVFNEYLKSALEFGYLGFQLQNKEENWSKADLLELLGCSESDLKSGQIAGGHLVFERNFALEHCAKWLEIMRQNNYHLLDNSESWVSNAPNFVSHRHDQSISSLLLKRYGGQSFRPAVEMEPKPGKLESQSDLGPFIAARNSSKISRINDNLFKRIKRITIYQTYRMIELVSKPNPLS